MIKEVIGRDPEVVKAIVSAMEKEDDVSNFVRGFVHEICGELTAFVCNLPWEDTRKALMELMNNDPKSNEILMSDKAEKWWNSLIEQSRIYLDALLEQAKQFILEQQEDEETEKEEERAEVSELLKEIEDE